MSYSPKQWRAIALYAKKNDAVPQLSAWPFVRFCNSAGDVEEMHVSNLEDLYDGHRAQERTRRAAERRAESKKGQRKAAS